MPENAEVGLQNNGTYYGSVAFYKCNDHFKLDGKTRTHAFASASRFEWQILTPIVHHASCFDRNDWGVVLIHKLNVKICWLYGRLRQKYAIAPFSENANDY